MLYVAAVVFSIVAWRCTGVLASCLAWNHIVYKYIQFSTDTALPSVGHITLPSIVGTTTLVPDVFLCSLQFTLIKLWCQWCWYTGGQSSSELWWIKWKKWEGTGEIVPIIATRVTWYPLSLNAKYIFIRMIYQICECVEYKCTGIES